MKAGSEEGHRAGKEGEHGPDDEPQNTGHELAEPRQPLLWSSDSVEAAQKLGKAVAGCGDLVAFIQVLQSPQGGPAQPSGIEHMGKAALDVLAPFAQQPSAIPAAHRAPGPAQSTALWRGELPQVAPATMWIRNDCFDREFVQEPDLPQREETLVTGERPWERSRILPCLLDTHHCLNHPAAQIFAAAVVSAEHLRLHDCARLQIHRVLGQANHVRGPVLCLSNLRVRIVRVHPLFIARLSARTPLVKAAQGGGIVRLQPRFPGQALHILPIALLGVALLERCAGSHWPR